MKLQTKIDTAADSYVAVILEPVKVALGNYSTKADAERALAAAAICLGNVKAEVVPFLPKLI